MKRIAQVIVSVIVATCMVVLAGCSSYPTVQQAEEAVAVEPTVGAGSLITDGVLTVGINSSNAPYAWAVDSSASGVPAGAIQGIDVDIALALGEQMGLTVKFVNVGTDANAASAGTVDVVMGTSPSQITDGLSVVLGSYADAAPAVFTLNPTGVVSLDDLIANPVGVQNSSASSLTLAEMAPTAVQQGFDTLNEAFEALEAGTVRYVVCDSFMGGYLAESYEGVGFAGALQAATTRGVAVAANNAALQTAVQSALDDLASDGIQGLIRDKWVGELPVISSSNQIAASTAVPVDTAATEVPAEGEAAAEGDAAVTETPVEGEQALA